MAISKQKKNEIVDQYKNWLSQSQAVILVEYTGTTVNDLDKIRAKMREVGGEFHVVKNTLAKLAFEASGFSLPENMLEKSTAVSFAFLDPAATAKAFSDVTKGVEAIKVKGGFIGSEMLDAAHVKALADMPPLPVMRAQMLGLFQAPAGKLVRTVAEPARSLASVFRAYSEQTQAAA